MPIVKKEFYFIRHGETDHHLNLVSADEVDVPLNNTGRNQALSVQPVIEKLPIRTICVSPLLRALETKEIIAQNVACQVVVIEELRECTGEIWTKMNLIDDIPGHTPCEIVHHFMEKTIAGINKALGHPGPVLIVAHGGIHWAMCHRINVRDHDKKIGNCVPVHFYLAEDHSWQARKLKHET